MDELKKYLRENRQELDVESPPRKEVWQHIQQQVPARSKKIVLPMVRWAAAACLVLLTGTAAYMIWKKPAQPGIVNTTPDVNARDQSPEILTVRKSWRANTWVRRNKELRLLATCNCLCVKSMRVP